MPDLHDGDRNGTGATGTPAAGRLLEDTGELTVRAHDDVFKIGPHRAPPHRRQLDGLTWYYLRLESLEWRRSAALALLGGALITDLLPRGYVLLGGIHRPIWHPRPGIDDVELAFFPWPPSDISPVQLMVRLVGSIRGP